MKDNKEMVKWVPLALIMCCMVCIDGAGMSAINGPIKTIVVLVMENRSFDHMLGWMKRLNAQIDGVTGQEWNPISTKDTDSAKVFFQDEAEYVDPDPGHSFQAIREQIFGSENTSANPAPMNGFAQQAISLGGPNMSQTVMNGFRPEVVPVYNTLVSEFAVFDRWFASVPASTQPNRLYVHSATSPYSAQFKAHASKGKLPNYVVVEQRYMDSKLFPANDMLKLRDTFDLVLDWFWIPLQRH